MVSMMAEADAATVAASMPMTSIIAMTGGVAMSMPRAGRGAGRWAMSVAGAGRGERKPAHERQHDNDRSSHFTFSVASERL